LKGEGGRSPRSPIPSSWRVSERKRKIKRPFFVFLSTIAARKEGEEKKRDTAFRAREKRNTEKKREGREPRIQLFYRAPCCSRERKRKKKGEEAPRRMRFRCAWLLSSSPQKESSCTLARPPGRITLREGEGDREKGEENPPTVGVHLTAMTAGRRAAKRGERWCFFTPPATKKKAKKEEKA